MENPLFEQIIQLCQNSPIGKHLPSALYVHCHCLGHLDPILQAYEQQGRRVTPKSQEATLVKFSTDKPKISYLFYPDFQENPHPVLRLSIVVDLQTGQFSEWNYQDSDNPPILHRKETFVSADYPQYQEFATLTQFEEALGLLQESRTIGTRQGWLTRLNAHHLEFIGHSLACPLLQTQPVTIARHKAAIVRNSLSRPVRLALDAGIFTLGSSTFFDYGCGYGGDVQRLREQGYESAGWDPYYARDQSIFNADVVNLGYVINVVEDLAERREALLKAWEITNQVLIVSAQVLVNDNGYGFMAYGDGIITRRNTFQKYYEQEELKVYIDQVLQVDSIPIALGIYLVFRDETKGEAFRLSCFRSRATTPRIQRQVKRFEDYAYLLTPLMEFYTKRGRLPVRGEIENEGALKDEFRTFHQAFKIVLQVTEPEEWEAIAYQRSQDLLLYFALSRFEHRPKNRELSAVIREDIKALFGSYNEICYLSDRMLLSLRNLDVLAEWAEKSLVGKKFKKSLLVHVSALDSLPPLLRLYEGCASRTVGRLEEVNVIKFSFKHPKISYLYYPDFDTDPHPHLQVNMEVYLNPLNVHYQEYVREENPPILHEKEQLVAVDYPHYEKFARLTQQEKDWGLLEDFQKISKLQGWLQCLNDHCATLKGHRVHWQKNADPYQIKLQKHRIKAQKKLSH